MAFDRAGHQIARDDAARLAVDDDDQVQHLAARVHLHAARGDLLFERLVRAQQQLLPRLPARVKRARNLHAAERARVEQSAVLARERNALRHALIDDVDADLRQAVDVGFARAEIAALHGVVEQALYAVAVVAVILRRVDAALRGDRVRAARAVLKAEAVHVVTLLAERRGRRPPASPEPTMMIGVLAAVRGIDQLHLEAGFFPLLLNWTGWNFRFEHFSPMQRRCNCNGIRLSAQPPSPLSASTEIGTETKPAKITMRHNPRNDSQTIRILLVHPAQRLQHAPNPVIQMQSTARPWR
jgi:hypothetical protein